MEELGTILQFKPKDSSGFDRLDKIRGKLITVKMDLDIKCSSVETYYCKRVWEPIESLRDGLFLKNWKNEVREKDLIIKVLGYRESPEKTLVVYSTKNEILLICEDFTSDYNSTINKINSLILNPPAPQVDIKGDTVIFDLSSWDNLITYDPGDPENNFIRNPVGPGIRVVENSSYNHLWDGNCNEDDEESYCIAVSRPIENLADGIPMVYGKKNKIKKSDLLILVEIIPGECWMDGKEKRNVYVFDYKLNIFFKRKNYSKNHPAIIKKINTIIADRHST